MYVSLFAYVYFHILPLLLSSLRFSLCVEYHENASHRYTLFTWYFPFLIGISSKIVKVHQRGVLWTPTSTFHLASKEMTNLPVFRRQKITLQVLVLGLLGIWSNEWEARARCSRIRLLKNWTQRRHISLTGLRDA